MAFIQQTWGFKRVLAESDDKAFINEVLSDPDAFLREANAQKIFKHDQTTTVALIASDKKQYVLKRYNARNSVHRIKRAIRRTRAWRCWTMTEAFVEAGLNVAPAVGLLEKRFGVLKGDAYFLSEYIDGEMLLNYLPEQNEKQQKIIAQEMRVVFDKMQASKVTHGDMKASNLLWCNEQIYFIDLDGASKHRNQLSWLRSHKRDKRRFMKNWRQNKSLSDLFAAAFL